MASPEALSKRRADSVVRVNEINQEIVNKLNDFLPTEQHLQPFALQMQYVWDSDPFVRDVHQIEKITSFLNAVNAALDSLLETVEANKALSDDLLELQASLDDRQKALDAVESSDPDPVDEMVIGNESNDPEEVESETADPDSDETEEVKVEKAEQPNKAQTSHKRGRPKK